MANSNKNIVIIPNINRTGNAAYAMTTVVADDNSLFWQNPTGQLFSIANNVTTGTTNGILVLNVTNSAGSVTPLRGSYFKVNRVSTANVGIFS